MLLPASVYYSAAALLSGWLCVTSPCWCVLSVHPCIVIEKKEVNTIYLLLSSVITESTRWRDKAHQIPYTIYRVKLLQKAPEDSSHDIYRENKATGSTDGRAGIASQGSRRGAKEGSRRHGQRTG